MITHGIEKKNEVDGAEYIKLDIDMVDNLDNNFDICFHLAANNEDNGMGKKK